jgi:hypothetical protein
MDSLLDCDYKIICMDSSNCSYKDNTLCDFYIDLDEPLRNVFKINIITILLNIPNNSSLNNNLETINIDLNNYRRLISKHSTIASNGVRNNLYYFDNLIIEKSDTTSGGNSTIKNDYNSADTIYYLNPLEPQLKRFSIRLFDKNDLIITKSKINNFIIKFGVYYNNKKSTRL